MKQTKRVECKKTSPVWVSFSCVEIRLGMPASKFSGMRILAGSENMNIDDKIIEGYIVGCDCESYFITPRLGVSVECPHCGRTELPENMLTNWTLGITIGPLLGVGD